MYVTAFVHSFTVKYLSLLTLKYTVFIPFLILRHQHHMLQNMNIFLLNKLFYCNTVYRETPVVHPVINKQNNKNKFTQAFFRWSVVQYAVARSWGWGLRGGHYCHQQVQRPHYVKRTSIGISLFSRFEHQHLLCEQHNISCTTYIRIVFTFCKKNKKAITTFQYILNDRSCLGFIRETKQIETHQLFFSLFFLRHNSVTGA